MTRLARLLAAAVASAGSLVLAASSTSIHVRLRVHALRAETETSSPPSPLVCPLGEGLDTPRVVLPCPHDCGGNSSSACVLYPTAWASHCAGDCVRGDACALQCLPQAAEDTWALRVRDLDPDQKENEASGVWVDASVVQGVRSMESTVLPPALRVVSIEGTDTSVFSVPRSFLVRVGQQVTKISLQNAVLEDDTDSAVNLAALRELRIMDCGLTKSPFESSQLLNLTTLDLSRNEIAELDANALPSQLQVLNIAGNTLTRYPDVISTLKNLRTLTLDHNPIWSATNDTLMVSSTIENLSLRNTSLHSIPETILDLKKLVTLLLDSNDLSNVSTTTFARLAKSLTQVSMDATSLRRLPNGLRNHSKISSLSLASNNFSSSSAIDCSVLPSSLQQLNLSSSSIRWMPKGLKNLSSLVSLDLSGNRFLGRLDASKMPSTLTSLNLSNCSLSNLPINLAKLPKLQTLHLENNPLRDVFPVRDVPNLKNLFLDGTNISTFESFPDSSALQTLSCTDCHKLISLPQLPTSLVSLKLSGVGITTLNKGVLPAGLQSLAITDSSGLVGAPEDLSAMANLVDLVLAGCNISEFTFSSGLQALETLSLASNSLVSFTAVLPGATSLDLSGNGLRAFDNTSASRLVHLNLARNGLETVPQAIFNMSTLQSLNLQGNPIRGYQPTKDELEFLLKIQSLSMDQDQFSDDCAAPSRVKDFSVCVKGDSEQPNILGSESTKTSTMKKASSDVVIALDILLVLGLFVAVVYISRRDKRERREKLRNEKQAIYAAHAAEKSPRMDNIDVETLAAYRLEKDAIIKSRRLGMGTFGEVWLAIYSSQRVAVKQLQPDEATPQAVQRFTREAKLLSELNHPSVVAFVGVAWTDVTDLTLVTVFAANGDLFNYLKNIARPGDGKWDAFKVQIALNIAEGLAYLHSLKYPVIHRDLQSRNVLLDDKFQARIGGFAGATRVRSSTSKTKRTDLPPRDDHYIRWLAPELLNGSPHDVSVDIFSFGVLLGELDTHTLPYASVQDETGEPIGDEDVKTRVADGTLRLALSTTCPRSIADLALRCSSFDPEERPRAMEVVKQLDSIYLELVAEQDATNVAM